VLVVRYDTKCEIYVLLGFRVMLVYYCLPISEIYLVLHVIVILGIVEKEEFHM